MWSNQFKIRHQHEYRVEKKNNALTNDCLHLIAVQHLLAVVCICFSVFLCHIISYHILHGISFLCHITSLCFRSVHSFEKIKIISPKWKRLQAYESFFSKHSLFGCLLGVFMYCSNHCQILCCHEGPRNRKEKKYGWMTMNDCRMFLDLDPSYDTSPPWPCKSWTEFCDP